MTTLQALVVLAALLAAGAAQKCRPNQFACESGQCIGLAGKCSGVPQCRDGSDEGRPTCSAPNTTLAVGDSLTARVDFDADHYDILFLLCDAANCSKVWLWSANDQGKMRFVSETGCNLEGWDCTAKHHDVFDSVPSTESMLKNSPGSDSGIVWPDPSSLQFPAGEVVFQVEHRALDLALWLRDFPRHVATVPANGTQLMLRVTPFRWRKEMPVQFTRSGIRSQGDPVDVGEMVQVRLNVSAGPVLAGVMLCEQGHCSRVEVRLEASGSPFNYNALVDCDGSGCRRIQSGNLANKGQTEYPFSVVLVALRSWEGDRLSVWVRGEESGAASGVATAPLSPGQSQLFVTSRPLQGMHQGIADVEFLEDAGFVGKCASVPPNVDEDGVALCGERQFRCDDGDCVCVTERCDGVPRCRDGSDESLVTCGAPNASLAVGESLVARVDFDEQAHSAVIFLLCDESSSLCSKLWLWRANRRGEMRYISERDCNMLGWGCASELDDVVPHGAKEFRTGVLVFHVQHRPSELAVWLQGTRPERAAVVPANDTQATVRVSPFRWRKDMAVTFGSE